MSDELYQRDEYRKGIELLPHYMQAPVTAYLETGRIPGGFLQAVISNDLCGAVGRADAVNFASLRQYAIFFRNFAPAACYGSPEKMRDWNRQGGLRSSKYFDERVSSDKSATSL